MCLWAGSLFLLLGLVYLVLVVCVVFLPDPPSYLVFSSFSCDIDLHTCKYLQKVTVNHISNFSFVSCYDTDFLYDFTVVFLCLKVYSCCGFCFSLGYLSNVTGILQQV